MRPEKLRVVPENEPVAERLCTIAGTVVDVVYQGVSTQLVVQTDAGTTLVVLPPEQRAGERRRRARTRARLVWDPEFNVVLADEPTLDKELTS